MPAEYEACVRSEIKSGKSKQDAQRICAISFIKRHGVHPSKMHKAVHEMSEQEIMELIYGKTDHNEAVNIMKNSIFTTKDVQFLLESKDLKEFEAHAAISLNPNITWMKFVLTDDRANLNRQRIPQTEFANVIRTGVHMPLKMAAGTISEGHEDTVPLGTMAHLLQKDNEIVVLAARWGHEREADVALLKQRFSEGKPIDISWELTHSDSTLDDEGVEDFVDVSMNAATIVGMPAYGGRTTVEVIASKNDLGDDIMELSEHEKLMTEMKTVVEAPLNTKITELTASLEAANTELTALKTASEASVAELAGLREFKTGVEAAEALATRIGTLRAKLVAAGLEVTDEYFAERQEKLLAMSDEQLDFFIQELVAFEAAAKAEATQEIEEASILLGSKRIPVIRAKNVEAVDEDSLLKHLKSLDPERTPLTFKKKQS